MRNTITWSGARSHTRESADFRGEPAVPHGVHLQLRPGAEQLDGLEVSSDQHMHLSLLYEATPHFTPDLANLVYMHVYVCDHGHYLILFAILIAEVAMNLWKSVWHLPFPLRGKHSLWASRRLRPR